MVDRASSRPKRTTDAVFNDSDDQSNSSYSDGDERNGDVVVVDPGIEGK